MKSTEGFVTTRAAHQNKQQRQALNVPHLRCDHQLFRWQKQINATIFCSVFLNPLDFLKKVLIWKANLHPPSPPQFSKELALQEEIC